MGRAKKDSRTTRYAVAYIVRDGDMIFRIPKIVVKSEIDLKSFITAEMQLHVDWGNIPKIPKLQKAPYELMKLDSKTSIYVAVIAIPDKQCSHCGSWDKAGYCPKCRGEFQSDIVTENL